MSELEQRLGYRFEDGALIVRSLVHRSYLNETHLRDTESNERLEFLGDAVIGFVIARDLYRRFPDALEGQLTELRAHLVRWETLAEAAKRLDLGAHLQLGRGEEQTGGRERPLNLARAFEAVVGAVLEDGSFRDAERLILRLLRPEISALQPTTNVADVKSRLQELVQARSGETPIYRTVGIEGPDHARIYHVQVSVAEQVVGEGTGPNKRTAERVAAAQALQRIGDDDV